MRQATLRLEIVSRAGIHRLHSESTDTDLLPEQPNASIFYPLLHPMPCQMSTAAFPTTTTQRREMLSIFRSLGSLMLLICPCGYLGDAAFPRPPVRRRWAEFTVALCLSMGVHAMARTHGHGDIAGIFVVVYLVGLEECVDFLL